MARGEVVEDWSWTHIAYGRPAETPLTVLVLPADLDVAACYSPRGLALLAPGLA